MKPQCSEEWIEAIALFEREGLDVGVLRMAALLKIDDKPETRRRWMKLNRHQLREKLLGHLSLAGHLDTDTGFRHEVNAATRALMLSIKLK